MIPVRFHPRAQSELEDAASYFARNAPGLRDAFLREIEAALAIVARHPLAGGATHGDHRRWVVRRFPYLLIYRASAEALFVVAVAHARQRPGYWSGRGEIAGEEVHEGGASKPSEGANETNAEQLRETTTNPQKRRLLQVKIDDDVEADNIFTALMAAQVEPRCLFIETNALNVRNLDV